MRLIYTVIFGLLSCPFFAQGWVKTFDLGNYESADQITVAADGNLFLMGHFDAGDAGTFILKTTPEGDSLSSVIIWDVEAAEFLEASDGHFWLTGEKESFPFLMKVNGLGEVLFEADFSEFGIGQRIKETADGGIIWTGFENSHPSKRIFDAEANLLEWHLLNQYAQSSPIRSAINDSLEVFFARGTNDANGNAAVMVIKLSETNEILWESVHAVASGCTVGINYLQALPEEGVVLVTAKQCMNWATPFLEAYRFDANGEKFAAGGYGHFQQYPWFTDIYPISEEESVFCGNTQWFANSSERYGLLGKIGNNTSTNILFPNQGGEYEIGGVVPFSDSCYFLIARHHPGISLIKTDQYGQLNNSNYLTGQLFHDENANCAADSSEANFENWTVELRDEMGDILNTQTSTFNGEFVFQADTGIYQITAIPPDSNWVACAYPFLVEFTNFFDTIFIETGWRDTCPDFSNAFQFNAICGDGNGEILIASTGGYGDFSYQWSNGNAGNTAQNLSAGQYFVTIQDNNCEYLDSVDMVFPKRFLMDRMNVYGGGRNDYIRDALLTANQEVVLFGETRSTNGDISAGFGRSDLWVMKADTLGNLLWEQSFGSEKHEYAGGLAQTADGGFILIGNDGFPNDDFMAIKMDENGVEEWTTIHDYSYNDSGQDILQTQDGGFVFVGFVNAENSNSTDWLIGKLDENGTLIWQQIIENGTKAHAVAETSTGDLMVTGEAGNQPLVVKLSATGDVLWENLLNTPNNEDGIDILILPNDEIVIQGKYDWIHKLSSDGNVLWAVNHQDRGTTFRKIELALDGGFLVAESGGNGETGVGYYPEFGTEAGFLKLDTLGQVEYDFHLKGEEYEYATKVLQKNENELIVCGSTTSNHYNYSNSRHLNEYNFFVSAVRGLFEDAKVLPQDTIFCQGSSEVLTLTNPDFNIQSVVWDDGSTAFDRLVEVVNDTIFSVVFETESGCVAADEIFVFASRLAAYEQASLPNCQGNNGTVRVDPIRGTYNLFANHEVIWETGDTSFSIDNLAVGSYDYVLSDEFCEVTGTIELAEGDTPETVWFTESPDHYLGSAPFVNPSAPVIDLVQSADGDFYSLWRHRLLKVTKEGTYLWSMYDNKMEDIFPLPNGNILGAGDGLLNNTVRAIIFDTDGEILMENSFSGTNGFQGAVVIKTEASATGDIFILAKTSNTTGVSTGNNGGSDIHILKLDAALNLLWAKNYGSSEDDVPIDFTILSNGNLVVVAITEKGDFDVPNALGEEDIWLFNVDKENGNLLWSMTYGGSGIDLAGGLVFNNNRLWLGANSTSSDGELALLNHTGGQANVLFEIDLTGNLIHIQTLGVVGVEGEFHQLNVNVDGTLAASFSETGSRLAKISATGELLWLKNMNQLTIPTKNNGFIGTYALQNVVSYQLQSGQWVYELYGKEYFKFYANGGIPTPVQLPADTTLCEGDILQLTTDFHPELTYNWSNGDTDTTTLIEEPGLYQLTVSTLPQCTHTDEILVDFCDEFNLIAPPASCESVELNAGFVGASYQWSTGDTTYATVVEDSAWVVLQLIHPQGNILVDSVFVAVVENDILVDANYTDSLCFDSDLGSIELSVSTNYPYQINWETGDTTAVVDGLIAGDYPVTISNEFGCQNSEIFAIHESPILTVTTTSNTPQQGQNDGAIQAMVAGGTPPYSYLWSTGATSALLSNIAGGHYDLLVTDALGCTFDASYFLFELAIDDDIGQHFMGASSSEMTTAATLKTSTKKMVDSSLAVFPNPFENTISIDFKNSETAISNLEIYNVLGKKMPFVLNENGKEGIFKIETSEWSSGTYFLHFQINNQNFMQKIIKT